MMESRRNILLATSLLSLLLIGGPMAAAERPLQVEDFFRSYQITAVTLNPRGDLYIAQETSHGISAIRVVDPSGKRSADVYRFAAATEPKIHIIAWVGNRTLLASIGDRAVNHFIRVQLSQTEMQLEFQELQTQRSGRLVLPLVEDEDEVLWSPYSDPRSVYRVAIDRLTTQSGDKKSPFTRASRIARMKKPVAHWTLDRERRPMLAGVDDSQGRRNFWFRDHRTEHWRKVQYRGESEEDWIYPVGIAPNGRGLLVTSNAPAGRIALYAYSPDRKPQFSPVVEHAERDLYGLVWSDQDYRILGVCYFEGGRLRFSFLDPQEQESWDAVERRFPNSSVWPVSRNVTGDIRVVWVGSAADAGRLVLLDESGDATDVGRLAPWLPPERMAQVRTLEIEVAGVGVIEAYLALPPTDEKNPPLIVYPHGGPIGIRDTPIFNPVVQYLASGGYAVLQVNYRGSSGLGREFERAGWRQWGRGIEDDIDAAIERVLSMGLANRHWMCIVGESYGGYSALISIVRHPKRFRCAASTAGVTDIGLLFASSDITATEAGREHFARIVGDPESDYEEMKRYSPVYRVEEMETPLLIVHGEDDARADVEHARRLAMMLELHGKEHTVHIYSGLGHSEWSRQAQRDHYAILMEFLRFHLE